MLETYMGAAHRNDKARDSSQAFKANRSRVDFVVGPHQPLPDILKFPVSEWPPFDKNWGPKSPGPPRGPFQPGMPDPYPMEGLPFRFPLGPLGAAAAGVTLGVETRKLIKEWDAKAGMPFYDDAQWQPYQVSEEAHFDLAEDIMIQARTDDIIKAWLENRPREWGEPPVWWSTSTGEWELPAGGTWTFAPQPTWGCGTGGVRRYGDFVHNAANPVPFIQDCPDKGSGLIDLTYGHGTPWEAYQHNAGTVIRLDNLSARPDRLWNTGAWNFTASPSPNPGDQANWVPVRQHHFMPGLYPGHGKSWDDAVADPGSQPSLNEQQLGQKLPRGQLHRGFYVQTPLDYPLVRLRPAPGMPPVTVPDVIIDVSPGPQPDTVTIAPPSSPIDFPSNTEVREQKPRNPIQAGAVFVNVASETNDFLEAMHKGLPKKYRSKGSWGMVPEPFRILSDIIKHWEHFDSQVALEAFVNNQIEDMILGKFYFGAASRATGRRSIRGLGPGAQHIPIPEVHMANGKHSISIGDLEIELVPGH